MPRPAPRPSALLLALCGAAAGLGACGHLGAISPPPPSSFPDIGYSSWGPSEPAYRLYPGDILDVAFPSAPELNREVTVQPDGRVALPLVQPVMAADLSTPDLQAALSQAYGPILVRPEVDVAVRVSTPSFS